MVCPGNLSDHPGGYSRAFLRHMFEGKSVSHILPYESPRISEVDIGVFLENRKYISISGVQAKSALILEKNKLRLTHEGERGSYILKPIPSGLKRVEQIPANEHLTMQIARQVYNIPVAENCLIFFKDGSPAYLTKRFDVTPDGKKINQEDFATLAEKSALGDGPDFKYEYSYEEMAALMKKFVPAYTVEIEKLFSLILFNYLFSNGDAHLKNFSLLETASGDHILSPAYDLLNTSIHVSDTDFALKKGLFAERSRSTLSHPGWREFFNFGKEIGIHDSRLIHLIAPFAERSNKVEALIQRSFLDQSARKAYLMSYNTRRNHLASSAPAPS